MICLNVTSFQQNLTLINYGRTDDLELRLQIVRLWCTKILIPIVCLIGISANSLNIIILAKPRMLSSTNCYLFAVAVCDLFYEAILILLAFRTHPQLESYVIYMSLVPYIMALGNSFSNIVGWLTCAFTVERYVAVTFPIQARKWCTAERSKLIIAVLVIIVFTVTLPDFFLRRIQWYQDPKLVEQMHNNSTLLSKVGGKYVLRETQFSKQMSKIGWPLITILQAYVLPLIILSIFNGLLIRSVVKASKKRKSLASKRYKSFKSELQLRNGSFSKSLKINSSVVEMCKRPSQTSDHNEPNNSSEQSKQLIPGQSDHQQTYNTSIHRSNELHGAYSNSGEPINICLNPPNCPNQEESACSYPQSGNSFLGRPNVPTMVQRSIERTNFGERQKITMMLILVVLVFCVFTMPSAVIHLTRELYSSEICKHVDLNFKILGNFANLALAINSSLNFFLYSWLSTSFRRTFFSLIKCQ